MNPLSVLPPGAALLVALTAAAVAAPIVHPGDTLGVNVLNYAALIDDSQGRLKALASDNVVVADDGSISIPVIGTVAVAGKSTQAIGELIQDRLTAYVQDPAVKVLLLEQSQRILLTGATIGTLPYLPGETVSSALGQLREELEKDVGPPLTPSDKNGGTLLRSAIDLRNIVLERDEHAAPPLNGEELLRSGLPGPTLAPGHTLRFASRLVFNAHLAHRSQNLHDCNYYTCPRPLRIRRHE
jgi:hypothetical protein